MDFLRLLAAGRCGALDTFFSSLTYFGSEIAFMAAALLIFWCVDKRQGYYVFLVGALGTVCNQFLKLAFRIPRPWVLDPDFQIVEAARADATGYSFPSGHTQNIVGTTASIFASRKEAWVRIVCVVLMVLVPFSRMYLGVHTPLDVGVAFLTALALAAALYPAFRTEAAAKKAVPWLLLGAAALCGGYLVYASSLARCDWPAGSEDLSNITHGLKNAYTMLGALLGFLIVYIADEKSCILTSVRRSGDMVLKLVLRPCAAPWHQGRAEAGAGVPLCRVAGRKLCTVFSDCFVRGHYLAAYIPVFRKTRKEGQSGMTAVWIVLAVLLAVVLLALGLFLFACRRRPAPGFYNACGHCQMGPCRADGGDFRGHRTDAGRGGYLFAVL